MKPIPEKFYKSRKHPVARDVGELKALLAQLPDDLLVQDGWRSPPMLVVYNYGSVDMHLQIVENDE